MEADPLADLWTCPRCGRRFAARGQVHTCAPPGRLEDHLAGRPAEIAAIVAAVIERARGHGPLIVVPERSRIALQARMTFAALMPRTRWVDGHVVLARRLAHPRFRGIETFSPRNHLHRFRLRSAAEVDDDVDAWLAEAHEVGMQRHRARPD
jgi:Domain of unknown function (DUF5655)